MMEVLCKKEKCHRNQVENATGTKSLAVHRGWPRLTSRLQTTDLPTRRRLLCCHHRRCSASHAGSESLLMLMHTVSRQI